MVKSNDLTFEYIRRDEEGNVTSIYKALDNVNIKIRQGDFIAILGHNGSGKSTLAKHINALLQPTEGTIWISGMNTQKEEMLWKIRETAGMVFQNPDNQLISNIVEEDVAFGPENLGLNSNIIIDRVKKALTSVGMDRFKKQSPQHLSGGQKQRIAIAGILAMQPKCIVLDEPTAMLDPQGRKEVIDLIRKLHIEKKITIILITHYMEEVVDADNVIVMHKGKVVLEGTPKEIFLKEKELKQYAITLPQITLLANELRKAGMNISEGILTQEQLVEEIVKNYKRQAGQMEKGSVCVNANYNG